MLFVAESSIGSVAVGTGPSVAGQIHALAFDADDPSTIYVGGDTFGISKYSILDNSWQFDTVGLENYHGGDSMYVEDLLSVRASDVPLGAPHLFAATRGGIYCRVGSQWNLMTPPTTHGYGYTSNETGGFSKRMIQFSALAYDGSRYLYAGAGQARFDEKNPNTFYTLIPTDNYHYVLDGPQSQYSLWRYDLALPGGWTYVTDTDGLGPIRGLSSYTDEYGTHHVAFATPSGVWDLQDDGTPELIELTSAEKMTPPPHLWSGNSWGVAFDDSGRLFILNYRGTGESETPGVYVADIMESTPPTFLGDVDSNIVVGTSLMSWESYLKYIDPAHPGNGYVIDLTTLAVRSNPGGSTNIIIGSRDSNGPALGGGYLSAVLNSTQGPETVVWHNMIRFTTWGTMNTLPLDANPDHETTMNGDDFGWVGDDDPPEWGTGCPAITPTVEFGFSPHNDQTLLAWMYAFPLLSTNGGVTWSQFYCTGSELSGWEGSGCNEMSVADLAHLNDGSLAIACRDWGVWLNNGPNSNIYKKLFPHQNFNSSKIESYLNDLYAVIETTPDATLTNVTSMIARYSSSTPSPEWSQIEHWNAFTDIPPHYIQYFTIDPIDGRVYAIATDPTGVSGDKYESTVLMGIPTGAPGIWTWHQLFGMQKRRYMDLLILPGARKLILADVDTQTLGTTGGIYCIDLDAATDPLELPIDPPQEWLAGIVGGDILGRAARRPYVLATDPNGAVLYAGTSGEESSSDVIPGTVLRLYGPFNSTEPPARDRWEILANNNYDSFGIGTHPFHLSGSSNDWTDSSPYETAQRMTDINDLIVDPDNLQVVYAAVEVSAMHPSNGVWVLTGEENWQPVTGISGNQTLPNRGPSCLAIAPDDPTRMAVGTHGQELFRTSIQPVESIESLARYEDKSMVVFDQGTGLAYPGTPYASLTFDYDADPVGDPYYDGLRDDLFVTIQEFRPRLFLNQGELLSVAPGDEGNPDYIDVSSDAFDYMSDSGYRGASFADFDNDGLVDLFVAHASTPKLLNNEGNNGTVVTFEDVTDLYGLTALLSNSWTAAWCDYNRDGYVDLFVGRGLAPTADPLENKEALTGLPDVLLENRTWCGEGFVDVSDILSGATGGDGCTLSASWAYVDQDRWPDLLAWDSSNSGLSRLWMNQQGEGFVEDFAGRFVTPPPAGLNSATVRTINADPYPDILLATETGVTYRHGMTWGVFGNDVPVVTGPDLHASAALVTDHDLDGHHDVLTLAHTADSTARMLSAFNPGPGFSFIDVTDEVGLAVPGPHLTAQAADVSGDGDPDLYLGDTAAQGGVFFFQNRNLAGGDEPLARWYGIRLVGDGGTNISGIGAEIVLNFNTETIHHVVSPEWGLGSGTGGVVRIGVGPDKRIVSAEIIWTDGTATPFTPELGAVVTVVDDTPPTYLANSFTATYEGIPNFKLNLVFEWSTHDAVDPAQTRIHLTNRSGSGCDVFPSTLAPTDEPADYDVWMNADGTYGHRFVWRGDCIPRCGYNASATCSTLAGQFTTDTANLTVRTCLDNIQIGE